MKFKRICAYILDILVISLIASAIFMCFDKQYESYIEKSEEMLEVIAKNELSNEELVGYQYDLNKSSSTLLIIKVGVTFFYFGIIPYLRNGRTLGKRIFGLRVSSYKGEQLRPGLFILRSIIVSNVLLDFINVLVLMLCSKNVWINVSDILSICSYLVYGSLFISMCVSNEERGLHDIICKTIVINGREK